MNITNKEYMKNLFRLLIGIAMITAIASCGGGNTADKKKADLEKLKAQYTELGEKIKSLESELSTNGDSSTVNVKMKDVAVTALQIGTFVHSIDVQGHIEGDENVMVIAKMPGTLIRLSVNAGDQVKAGQVLGEIESTTMAAQLADLKTNYALVKDVYLKQKALWDQKVGTELQFLQAKTNKESLEQKINQLNETIDMFKIKAPFSGTVDEVMAKIGQTVGSGSPVLRIVNLNKLKVKAELAESYSASVHTGDKVNLAFPDINKSVSSTVLYTGKVINPMTRTFNVEVALPSDNIYRPNMVAQVGIIDYQNNKALVVPINTIQNIDGKDYVFVASVKNGKKEATKKEVKVGLIYNGKAEIVNGLNEGDMLITTGYVNLNEGELLRF